MTRRVVVGRNGVALAEPADSDLAALRAASDGLFDVDPDPRAMPIEIPARRLTIVDDAGTVLGNVSWIPVIHGPTVDSVAWNIGVHVLPPARGRGVGSLAQRMLVEHLFATTDTYRIEAGTDVENVAEQRALAKVGMTREGTVRGAQVRDGVRRDMALYSILRPEL